MTRPLLIVANVWVALVVCPDVVLVAADGAEFGESRAGPFLGKMGGEGVDDTRTRTPFVSSVRMLSATCVVPEARREATNPWW